MIKNNKYGSGSPVLVTFVFAAIGIPILVFAAIGIIGYIYTTTNLQYLNKPVVERMENRLFTNDIYRVQLDGDLIEIYHDSENYKTAYEIVNFDSLEFYSPSGEKMIVKFRNYSKPESVGKTDIFNQEIEVIKVIKGVAGFDGQTELILSSMDSTEVVLKKEESPFSLRNFFNTMDKYLKMGFVE